MSLEKRGFNNKILKIDLTHGSIRTEKLNEKIVRLLLGGKGLGSYLLYHELKPHTDPLSPDNVLIFVIGPLTGTTAPTSSRLGLLTKSPATGAYLDAYCGGFFGHVMKYAGYDAIIIRGTAESPKVLIIDDEKVRIEDGRDVWTKNTLQASKWIKAVYGKDFQTAVIGPAGEARAGIAGIFCDLRTFGRGGAGAVMGSKQLKGIAVRGTGAVRVADPDAFEEAVWIAHRMLRMSSQIKRLSKDGTANILELIQASGALPTRNFQSGEFEAWDRLRGDYWRKNYWIKDTACYGCPMACTKFARSKIRNVVIDGPEYETIFALGSNCGVTDHEAIIYANHLCDLYGIDTISTGVIIGFVMELYQRNMISGESLDGIEARWGSGDALIRLTEKIAKGEGIGSLLSRGVREIAKAFPGSDDFAMHVKGLEMPGYLPRAAKGIALSYAMSERGACHLRGSPLNEILGGADPLTVDGKAALFRSNQLDVAVVNASILCYFVKFGITLKEIFQLINACTGFQYENPRDLEQVGERITNLCRLYNIREGFTTEEDTLPKRSLMEPLPSGYGRGHVVELEKLRSDYFQIMEWDVNGIPKEETIRRLELDQVL